jgi:hypothetical protein
VLTTLEGSNPEAANRRPSQPPGVQPLAGLSWLVARSRGLTPTATHVDPLRGSVWLQSRYSCRPPLRWGQPSPSGLRPGKPAHRWRAQPKPAYGKLYVCSSRSLLPSRYSQNLTTQPLSVRVRSDSRPLSSIRGSEETTEFSRIQLTPLPAQVDYTGLMRAKNAMGKRRPVNDPLT